MAKHIKNFLEKVFSVDHENWKTFLLMNWASIIGELNNRVSLEKIQDSTLVLGVNNTSWMQELYLLSPILIQNINAKLDKPYVKNVRFKYIPSKSAYVKPLVPDILNKKEAVLLHPKEQQALNSIKDQELKDVLYKFLIRCHKER